jgi:hypothetical protein
MYENAERPTGYAMDCGFASYNEANRDVVAATTKQTALMNLDVACYLFMGRTS